MVDRAMDKWLPGYVGSIPSRAAGRRARRTRTTHVVFLVCDHFEPRHRVSDDAQAYERIATWQREYPKFQRRCRDAFGTVPLHTFFYPPHHGEDNLPALAAMVHDGLGEVELHYHHADDTAESLRRNLGASIERFQRHGLLLQAGEPPGRGFGFIHGDWALDNSCGGRFCGVNGELSVLASLGCWGDFTMPSRNECQTRKINSIYYAVDDPARSKSHDRGTDARVGAVDPPGLFLMQGPLAMNWRAPGHPRIESASLTTENWGRPDRIATWIDCQVHVKGRPEWLFVKLHTHGAIERDYDALFGERAFQMHRMLNESYNDGERFVLHYATARQAYNIAKAAEAGLGGSPAQWVDYRVAPPAAQFYTASVAHRLDACGPQRLALSEVEADPGAVLRCRVGAVRRIDGAVRAVAIDAQAGTLHIEAAAERTAVTVELAAGASLAGLESARMAAPPEDVPGSAGDQARRRYRVELSGSASMRIQSAASAVVAPGPR
jgi:hypothetical protein